MTFGVSPLNKTILKVLDEKIEAIETEFNKQNILGDFISYTGNIDDSYIIKFREFIERVNSINVNSKILIIILGTPGGSATAVEKMVEIIRYHYDEIYFVVPNYAMSAGTIFCMSGDKIFMDYSSSLGPIDPQVRNDEGKWVPALGYIDKVNELIAKSKAGTMSDAEFIMFQKLDLGTIKAYEQARDLSIKLLKTWLVKYKFKNWNKHKTHNSGSPVSVKEKVSRAESIAKMLSDNNRWHSHGRYIGINTLKEVLKLEIEDYTSNKNLRTTIIEYDNLLKEFVAQNNRPIFFHMSKRSECDPCKTS